MQIKSSLPEYYTVAKDVINPQPPNQDLQKTIDSLRHSKKKKKTGLHNMLELANKCLN